MEEEQSQAHHDLMGLGRKVLQKKLKEKKEYSFPDEVDIPAILGPVFFVLLRRWNHCPPFELR
jgi:hypothetical protein